MVVLDTNIIIDHLRQSKKETFLLKIAKQYPKQILALSVISIQELYEGQSTKKNQLEQLLLATVSPLTILAYTFEVSILAGQIARDLTQPIEFADSAIAATCIINNAELLTLNSKHFNNIPNLKLLNLLPFSH
ncbi:MAG: PIN domain-containing protein [Candidatus Beckwithbacteria bacterium]